MRGPPVRHPDEQREQLPAVEGIIQDAGELRPGDRVVYPNQGVCAVVGVEEKDISGQKLVLVKMKREEDGAAVMVPKGKVPSIGLRRVASGDQIEGVFHYLAAQFDDPELDWKVRHRDNADRLIAGGVLGVAEVVKGLHSLSRIRPLPTKEREQYDNARHLLVHEVAVSLAVPAGLAEDYVDYALMPPAGTKFDLKPPPKPVLLPSRPKKRRPAEADEDDLGLGDLGIELPPDLQLPGEVELPEGVVEGAEEGEGAGAEAGAAPAAAVAPEGDEGEAEEAPPRKPAAKAAAKEKPAPAAARKEKEKEKPAAKEAAKAAPKEKPAPAAAKKEKEKEKEKPAAKAKPAPAKAAREKPAPKAAAKPAAKKPARGGKKK